ncbi:MAG: cobalamin biosynthesis protein CobW [Rhizobiaceae bacterium]|jgi:cobalamin biosynthesis protein CobW|nr:cobalamin biosynthesis protein CobW [Rhizobiaceae bacterium]
MDAQKIPATVITGFLGAGKTTLIRNMLATANGRRIALIINEFGDLGVDGDVLKGCGDETCSEDDIVELNNGCICCTVADDFVPTMEKLLARENRPDHIVIETSGLALPQPLVNAFNWPEIREQVTVDGVVTIVDSRAVADGRFAADVDRVKAQREADEALDHESPLEELFEDQLTCADMIVFNKADLVEGDVLTRVQEEVGNRISRSVKLVKSAHGSLPAEVLLGLGSATEGDIQNRKSHHELHHEAFHAEHGEDAEHDHDHDEFESFVVSGAPVANRKELVKGLARVIEEHDILRLKGFIAVEGKPMRLVVQAVGNRIDHYFDREWEDGETASSRLVVIGLEGLHRDKITSQVSKLLG